MMNVKMTLVVLMTTLMPALCRAQFLGGFFNQKGTERKLLVQQIAALEVYKRYLKGGYKIVTGGIHAIRDIKKGDFGLHNAFFSSLRHVNPVIKKYAKVGEIISLQLNLVRTCSQHLKMIRQSGALTEEELLYITRVLSRLLDQAAALLEELFLLTSDGKMEIKDAERMERIDGLYAESLQQYTFLKSFNAETMQLAFSRQGEYGNIERLKTVYGIY